MSTTTVPAVLRTPEASIYTGIPVPSLEKGRVYGGKDTPPFVQLGKRRVGYLRSDLDTWLESRRRQSTSESEAA